MSPLSVQWSCQEFDELKPIIAVGTYVCFQPHNADIELSTTQLQLA